MGMVEGRGIVRSVSGNGDHLTVVLKHSHKALLVGRTGTTHHLETDNAVIGLIIREGGEVGTGYYGVGGRLLVYYSYLAAYLTGSSGGRQSQS